MKKGFLVSAISVLSTIAIGGGALVICDKLPSTKDKFSIRFGDKVLFGEETADALSKDEELIKVAEENGLAVVNYVLEDQTVTVIQKVGKAFDIDLIPTKEGCSFIGWSTTEDGSSLVANIDSSCDLYPVFVSGEGSITIHKTYGSKWMPQIINCSIGQAETIGAKYNLKLAGLSTSRDSIQLVSNIEADQEYYAVFCEPGLDKLMTLDEAEVYKAECELGEKAHYNVTFIATGVKYEGEFRNIKYNGTSILPQTMNVEGVNYRLYGFATDPDSTTLYSSDYFTFNFEIEENGIYYAVYQASYPATGYVTSAWLESKMEIKVNVLGKVNQYDANYKKISTYTSFDTTLGTSITQSQVTFEFKGWAVDPDSTEYHDIEYIQENDIAEVYAVYERSDTSELITVNEFSELMKYYVSNISVYDSTSYNGSKSYYTVYLLEGYQKDVTINDTTYEFAGWSTSSTSTELVEVDLSTSNYMSPLYAVYKCDEEYYTISGLKTVSEMVNKVNVVTFNEETVVEYDNLADFEMLVDILGIPFEFNGWALDPDSTDVVDSTYVTENKIRSVYAVYMNMETAELMTVQGLKDFEASQYVSMVHTFEGDLENVNPVDFEYGVDVNGTYYEFYGWASEPTTELIEADLYEYDELYAIYANPETGELISVVDLQAL